ncbi:class I SAM-dependent methyltransferase [Caulobacter sp. NIBR2454]|uniref:class I SAM-dependent methyltransferase n=1 Tax=Caulobacter sp. NIBR2454 TaxID=3015996 RepID=UPI0022B5FEF5|nr:class I SAM-dependent methyltransferase [Caulobacter sp. NIBR2454]
MEPADIQGYMRPMTISDLKNGDAALGVYGVAQHGVIDPPRGVQFSPLIPDAQALEYQPDGSLDAMVVAAPPGVLERRYVLALALRALKTGGRLTALAPKDKGGSRLRKELEAFGCVVTEDARRHHRICMIDRPVTLVGIEEAIAAGAPQIAPKLSMWSQPGVFSWDRADPGSALLLKHLPKLSGAGLDAGCGVGLLARDVLARPTVTKLTLIDIDRRATDAARRNIEDPRAEIVQADIRDPDLKLADLDFVVMNPPFHDGGHEDKRLGQAFVQRAADLLRKGGHLWLTANRHLPYEAALNERFTKVELRAEEGGFKIYEARK